MQRHWDEGLVGGGGVFLLLLVKLCLFLSGIFLEVLIMFLIVSLTNRKPHKQMHY